MILYDFYCPSPKWATERKNAERCSLLNLGHRWMSCVSGHKTRCGLMLIMRAADLIYFRHISPSVHGILLRMLFYWRPFFSMPFINIHKHLVRILMQIAAQAVSGRRTLWRPTLMAEYHTAENAKQNNKEKVHATTWIIHDNCYTSKIQWFRTPQRSQLWQVGARILFT